MLYINHLKRVIVLMPLRVIFLLVTSFLIFGLMGNKPIISEYVGVLAKEKTRTAYFNALFNANVEIKDIQRKLVKLPGVDKVVILDSETIEKSVSKVVSGMNIDLKLDPKSLITSGVRVEFAAELGIRAQELVRDYLLRLAGEKNSTLGSLNNPKDRSFKKSLIILNNYFNFVFWTVVVLIMFLWLSLFHSLQAYVRNMNYILTRFHRRNNLKLGNTAMLFLLVAVFPASICFAVWGIPSIALLIILSALAVISFGSDIYQSKWTV